MQISCDIIKELDTVSVISKLAIHSDGILQAGMSFIYNFSSF